MINRAIFFSGRIKGYNRCIRHLLSMKNEGTIFFLSINADKEDKETSSFCRLFDITNECKYIEKQKTPDEIFTLEDTASHINVYSMFYHNYKCYQMIEKYQDIHDIKFDVIIKYRADVFSTGNIDDKYNLPLKPKTILVPSWGCKPNFINDQIAIGDNETMKIYCNVVNNIMDLCQKNNVTFIPEIILAAHLDRQGITVNYFKWNYHLVRCRHIFKPTNTIKHIIEFTTLGLLTLTILSKLVIGYWFLSLGMYITILIVILLFYTLFVGWD